MSRYRKGALESLSLFEQDDWHTPYELGLSDGEAMGVMMPAIAGGLVEFFSSNISADKTISLFRPTKRGAKKRRERVE